MRQGEYGLALTLGGGEVPLLDLTAAFGAFANGGHAVRPVAIERIETMDGRQLVASRDAHGLSQSAISAQVAYLITHILSDDGARMAGFGEGSMLRLTRPAAAKTGTTTDWRDNWTVGYTPSLVAGVWVGNADNEPMQGVSGLDGAAPIWHDFMETALRDQPVMTFPQPEGLVEVEVCADSGLLPTEPCPRRRTELFIAGTEPREACHMHRVVRLDRRTGELAGDTTPPADVLERVYLVLPAELQEWAREERFPQPPLPRPDSLAGTDEPHLEAAGASASCADPTSCVVLTSPDRFARYRLRAGLPAAAQRIEVSARPGDGMAPVRVALLVDGETLATLSAPPYHAWWQLEPGEHEFWAMAVDANDREHVSDRVRISVSE
jgi:membrane peptidoglycan carboxypeptidase